MSPKVLLAPLIALSFALASLGATAQPLLATYLAAGCGGRDRVPAFEQWLGRKVDRMNDFLASNSWAAMISTADWVGHCWGADWGGRMNIAIPLLPRDGSTLEAGAAGAYDEQIRKVAANLVRRGLGASVIRLGWEFNANWFPWSAQKKPEAYVAFYRRFVGLMREVPGAQFRFDWCAALGLGVASPEPAYPGDDVVDIIGADVYNVNWLPPTVTPQQRWQLLVDAPFGLKWHRRFAAEHGKPMSYPEWGTGTRPDGHGGGDDPVFMSGMIDWISANAAAIEYQGYWDYRAPDFDAKLSEGRQPQSAALFLKAFGGGGAEEKR